MERRCWTRGVAAVGLVAIPMLLAGSREAQAFVTTFGCAGASSCTLAELFAGGSIQVNTTLRFENWELEFVDPDGVQPDYTLIVVEGRDDGGLLPGNGIQFSANSQLRVTGADRLELAIGFTVTDISATLAIGDASLGILSDSVAGDAYLQIGEFLTNQGGVGLGQMDVESDFAFATAIASDGIEFPTLQTGLIVEKDILLQASLAGASAELDVFEQRFSLPEPESPAMLVAGLLALWGLRRLRTRCPAVEPGISPR